MLGKTHIAIPRPPLHHGVIEKLPALRPVTIVSLAEPIRQIGFIKSHRPQ
jgi:hypothetical protein